MPPITNKVRLAGPRTGPPGRKNPLPAPSSSAVSSSSAAGGEIEPVIDLDVSVEDEEGDESDALTEEGQTREQSSNLKSDVIAPQNSGSFRRQRVKVIVPRIGGSGSSSDRGVKPQVGQKRRRSRRDVDGSASEGGNDQSYGSQSRSGTEEEASGSASRCGSATPSGSGSRSSSGSESEEDELALGAKVRRKTEPNGTGKSNGKGKGKEREDAERSGRKAGKRMISVKTDSEEGEPSSVSSSSIQSPGRAKRAPANTGNKRRAGRTDSSAYSDTASQSITSTSSLSPLFTHRSTCDKCLRLPAAELYDDAARRDENRKRKGGKRRTAGGAGGDMDFLEDEIEGAEALGGWAECSKCCSSYHWSCLPPAKRNELIKYDKMLEPRDRQMRNGHLHMDDSIDLECHRCADRLSRSCKECKEERKLVPLKKEEHGAMVVGVDGGGMPTAPLPGLLFRCVRCKRASHYDHLPPLDGIDSAVVPLDAAERYQDNSDGQGWYCGDCRKWSWRVDTILAWRPCPTGVKEPKRERDELPDWKGPLPREYLIKWQNRGFRHVRWLPHDWMAIMETQKLANFLKTGPKLVLDTDAALSKKKAEGDHEDALQAIMEVTQDDEHRGSSESGHGQPNADPSAMDNIPVSWSTVDRVLGVWVMRNHSPKNVKGKNRVDSEEPDPTLEDGRKPHEQDMIALEEWEANHRRKFGPEDVEEVATRVVWTYVKWQDLQYNACTYDTPPPRSSLWLAFKRGLLGYLKARKVVIPTLTEKQARLRDKRSGMADFQKMTDQPDCIIGGTLMDFQLEGLNWLLYKWYKLESCILADDMGLGKTVQIASLLGLLGSDRYHIYPFLVVVPNSTLQNWIREFEKWAPHLRVVPYYGIGDSRTIIQEWELFHPKGKASSSGLKAHVVVTSYEGITMLNDFRVLNKIPRWEMLIVDEAQRLKNDKALIYRRLREMKVTHKVLLTGTPLNNTVREILNLLHFLDPPAWPNLDELEKKYAEPDEALFKELRERIAPYMLRRRKDDVLDLPAKNEMIVPLSMRPLQKQVYRSVMEKNADLMEALARATQKTALGGKSPKFNAAKNMLMQLRKCAQHPYLNNPALEDMNASSYAQQQSLIDASAKLVFLRTLLPKLKARGHRVLIFSQFVIALNLFQDFCDGEGYRFLRLDGNTPQDVRQKDIDKFNAPNSDYFIYMLSTRAGGVGINLASADAVIVADLDFNPHLDMQAIARAHRFGQKKKVMVFRLMMKRTVEETIMQMGKKKLMLDHLIVQTIQKDDEEDFSAILLNGARAIFEETDEQEVSYDAEAVDIMITELETREEAKEKTVGFTFAPIYDSKTNKVVELEEEIEVQDGAADFWKDVLERANADRAKAEQELYGRGARRAAQAAMKGGQWDQGDHDEPPSALGKNKGKPASPASDYAMSDRAESDGGDEDDGTAGPEDLSNLGMDPATGGIVAVSSGRKKLKAMQSVNGVPAGVVPGGTLQSGRTEQVNGSAAKPSGSTTTTQKVTKEPFAQPDIYPLLPQEQQHLWNQLGRVQAYRQAGALFHAAKAMISLLFEVCVRTQIKGHSSLLQNAFDASIPAKTRAKRYRQMCIRVDQILVLSGSQAIFATREGLAIAAYLFAPEGELMYEMPRPHGYVHPDAPQDPQVVYPEQREEPEYAYRTLDSANGSAQEAIALDDDENEVQVPICGFCMEAHPAASCYMLRTVEGIDACMQAVDTGDDAEKDSTLVRGYLLDLRAQRVQEAAAAVAVQRQLAQQAQQQAAARAVRPPAMAVRPPGQKVRPAPSAVIIATPAMQCPICGGPPHAVKDCGVMKAGVPGIHLAMARLAGHPVVSEMRAIMDRQLIMAMAVTSARKK